MPVIGMPALVAVAVIGLFVAACNEEPQQSEPAAPKAETRAQLKRDQETVDPKAPRMLEPTKPGGSGTTSN